MVLPSERPFLYFTGTVTQICFPTTMQWNLLPLSECDDAVLAIVWLNWNMPLNSCLIGHENLFGWAELNVHFRPIYQYGGFYTGLLRALEMASLYNTTFVITQWNYDFFIRTAGFNPVFRLGSIEVFKK